jgi:hypothetical protein
MHYPGYNEGQIQFIEGRKFIFKIYKLLLLQDDKWYYVLLDGNGLKHFLPQEFYQNYNYQIGEEISCVVDKINCTGRIFLEPEHPYYMPGKEYLFEVYSSEQVNQLPKLLVKDIFENFIEVELKGVFSLYHTNENQLKCKVIKIKKGLPILELIPVSPTFDI